MIGTRRKGRPYFAYGSNMLEARLRERCPSASKLGVAKLPGYRLRFDKRSWKDGSGKCRIEQTGREGDRVWGVLYDVGGRDLAALDEAEGRGNGYEIGWVEVRAGGETVSAFSYLAGPDFVDPTLVAFDWYLELVVAGARETSLPESYVAAIETVHAIRDEDRERAREARDLLVGSASRTAREDGC